MESQRREQQRSIPSPSLGATPPALPTGRGCQFQTLVTFLITAQTASRGGQISG